MEDREKNSKKTEKKFLLFKEKVYLPIKKSLYCTEWIDESMRVAH